MHKLRKLLVIAFTLGALLILPSAVMALSYGNVAVYNYERSNQLDPWSWNGTYGRSYIQSSQYIWDEHLNSVYMWNDYYTGYTNMYEAGWTWFATNGTKEYRPRNFAAWVEWNVYRDTLPARPGDDPSEHLNINLGRPAAGMSHSYHVFLETRTNPWQIQWYFDGNKATKIPDHTAQVSFGRALASSERQTSSDNNWAHWMDLKRNESPTVVGPWSTFNVFWDDDPNYYAQAVTTTEFYVWPQ